jgi:hypothetical protein
LSISFLFDENRGVASAGLGDAAVGGALSVPDRTARSNSERAVSSANVGNRFRLLRSVDLIYIGGSAQLFQSMLAGEIAFGVGGGPSIINVNSHRTSIVAIEGTLNRMIMKIMASVPSVTLDLFSCSLTYLLRENHDAIRSDTHVGVEV